MITYNDLDNKSNSNHTHSNYVTSDQVSTIVNNSIESGEITVNGSMIRNITRGVIDDDWKGEKTISCSITDPNKVIVLLDFSDSYNSSSGNTCSGNQVCLISVTTTGITLYRPNYIRGWSKTGYKWSYQIIEFM